METRRFILIDPSIKKPGGHHYEYAQRILDAAARQRFETVLLAHREYRGQVTHRVLPAFTATFWDHYNYYYGRAPSPRRFGLLVGLRSWAGATWLTCRRRFVYSRFGLALARARHVELKDILLRPWLEDDASVLRTSRPLLALGRILLKFERVPRRARLLRLGSLVALVAASPPLAVLLLLTLLRAGRKKPAARFAAELARALRGEADLDRAIIFVPNATAAELEGLALLARAGDAAARGHWAFLYRRPVFTGYPNGYKAQSEGARRHRVELARLRADAGELSVRFYTDTDELTEQYAVLGIYPFETLPVPVELPERAATPDAHAAPLVIGYLGDARDEKGFPHLPKLVEAFAPRPGSAPSVRFLFQANFNVPDGEPGSRYARSVLQSYDRDFVELSYGPFDSAHYAILLLRMDIVLIPYVAENYSARSSGVLMEALSAGLPVLAPTCSWMARLAEPSRRRHLLGLFEGYRRGIRRVAHIVADFERINDRILRIDASANYLFVRLAYDQQFDGYVRITVSSINEFDISVHDTSNAFKATNGEVVAAFSKPPSPKMWWKAEPIEKTIHERPVEVAMSLFLSDDHLPLCAGIALFDTPEQIAPEVQGLVRFYEHHRNTARRLGVELKPLYDPAVLVSHLASRTALPAGAQPAPQAAA